MEPRAAIIQSGFDIAHMVFNAVVADLEDQAAASRIGNVPSAAAIFAHAIYGEDMMVGQADGAPMLLESGDWRERTGITIVSPGMTPEWLALKLNVGGLKQYGEAVFARTGAFLLSATAADFDRTVRSPMGQDITVGAFLNSFGLVHISEHAGEISALKGAQGLKGLPF